MFELRDIYVPYSLRACGVDVKVVPEIVIV